MMRDRLPPLATTAQGRRGAGGCMVAGLGAVLTAGMAAEAAGCIAAGLEAARTVWEAGAGGFKAAGKVAV